MYTSFGQNYSIFLCFVAFKIVSVCVVIGQRAKKITPFQCDSSEAKCPTSRIMSLLSDLIQFDAPGTRSVRSIQA